MKIALLAAASAFALTALTAPALADRDDHRGYGHHESGDVHHESGDVHGAPGPIAGAGLPILAIGYGVYWLVKRRRKVD